MSTVVGAVSQSIVGDNAVGTNAAYLNPQYVTFDNSFQNLYISEYGRGAIRAVNIATGVATTVAGAPMTNPVVNTQALVDGFGLAARLTTPATSLSRRVACSLSATAAAATTASVS